MAVAHGDDFQLFPEVLNEALLSKTPPALNLLTMMERFDDVEEALFRDSASLIGALIASGHREILEKIDAPSLDKVPDTFLHFLAKNKGIKGSREFTAGIDTILAGLGEDEWTTALLTDSSVLRVQLARRADDGRSPPTPAFRPAVLTHALAVLRGERTPEELGSRWAEVIECLLKPSRRGLCADIVTNLRDTTPTTAGVATFARLYLELWDDFDPAMNSDVVIERLLARFLGEPSKAARVFLSRHGAVLTRCLQAASEETRASFVSGLESTEGTGDEVRDNWAAEVRRAFSLQRPVAVAKQGRAT